MSEQSSTSDEKLDFYEYGSDQNFYKDAHKKRCNENDPASGFQAELNLAI